MPNSFGQVVKALRKKSGLTLEKVAKRIGSHKGYVSGIENEKVNPPSAVVTRKLFRVYAKTLEEAGVNATEADLVELGWACKAPKIIRDRVMGAIAGDNPLPLMEITVTPGAPAMAAIREKTEIAPRVVESA